MTLFSRKTLMTTIASASLALAGAALTTAPAMAGGWHSGHGFHKGGFRKGGFHKGFFYKKHHWYGRKFGYGYGYPSYFAYGYGGDFKGTNVKRFARPEVRKDVKAAEVQKTIEPSEAPKETPEAK